MNRTTWISRGAAAAAVVLAVIALSSMVAIGREVITVDRAKTEGLTAAASAPVRPAPQWKAVRPALRRNGTTAEIAIGEYLNGRLGELGLNVVSVTAPDIRPLGGGLQLAEVHVQARGDAAASAATANWVAVNREAVRLKSLTLGVGPDQEGTCTLVLLMVIA